jgi:hypothetical protein
MAEQGGLDKPVKYVKMNIKMCLATQEADWWDSPRSSYCLPPFSAIYYRRLHFFRLKPKQTR